MHRDRREIGSCLGLEGGDGERWGKIAHEYGASFGDEGEEDVLKLDSGDGCTILCIY